MQGSFTEIITASFEWTRTILFKPKFNFKKWLFLFLIALLAGQLQGSGCSGKFDLPSPDTKEEVSEAVDQAMAQQAAGLPGVTDDMTGESSATDTSAAKGAITAVIITAGIMLLIIALAFRWLSIVFSFIFIESIVNNDASVAKPFGRNIGIGTSYFGLDAALLLLSAGVYGLIIKACFDALKAAGIFEQSAQLDFGLVFSTVLPYIGLVTVWAFIGAIVGFFLNNYVRVVIYSERGPVLKAVSAAFSLFLLDKAAFLKYLLVTFALWILVSMIAAAIVIAILIVVVLIGLIVFGILALIFKALPAAAQTVLTVIGVALLVPLLIILWFLLTSVFLPFAVFMRTFNIKTIARIDQRYNLFRPAAQQGAAP